jgi:hypothetical protein
MAAADMKVFFMLVPQKNNRGMYARREDWIAEPRVELLARGSALLFGKFL